MKSENENRQSWSVGVTCFNEEATIEKVVRLLQEVLPKISSKYEIIIVDDCSTDNSHKIIEQLAKEDTGHIKTIYHKENQGIGITIRDVYFNACYENLTYVPGDAQFNAQELIPVARVENKTYISFYRRRKHMAYSNFRSFMSYLNRVVNRNFTGLDLRDVNWVNVYKLNDIKKLDLTIQSSIIVSEICAKLNLMGYRAIEIESVYHPRIAGTPKGASFRNIKLVALETVKLIKSVRKFKRKLKKVS